MFHTFKTGESNPCHDRIHAVYLIFVKTSLQGEKGWNNWRVGISTVKFNLPDKIPKPLINVFVLSKQRRELYFCWRCDTLNKDKYQDISLKSYFLGKSAKVCINTNFRLTFKTGRETHCHNGGFNSSVYWMWEILRCQVWSRMSFTWLWRSTLSVLMLLFLLYFSTFMYIM